MREELLFTRNAFVPVADDAVDIDPLVKFGFLYVGTGGDVKVTTIDGTDIMFTNVPSGSLLGGSVPLAIRRVWLTDLTAADLVVLHNNI